MHTNNKAHSEAHKFTHINTLTFTDTHIGAFPQIQPYINKITQKDINMLTCVCMLTNTFIQTSTHIFTPAKIYSQWTALTYEQAQIHTDTVTFMLTCKNVQTKVSKEQKR